MDRLVKPEELQTLIIKKLEETGLNVTDAKVVADVLIHADMRGVRSHGAIRLEHYCNRINAGGMNLNSKYKFEKTAVAAGVLDADGGMGHVACNIATDLAIEHVQKTGIFAVTIKNTSHAGALSYFGEKATRKGLIAIAMANVDKCVTPFGSAEGFIGSNPIAFCYPGKKHSLLLDMATSETAFGKIYVAQDNNQKIPLTWAVDAEGVPTDDPHKAVYLQPFGAHKGTGIALAIESLTGVGFGAFGPHVVSMYGDLETQRNCTAFLLLIDPNIFGGGSDFYANLDKMIDEIHALKPAKGFDKVMVPGEIEKASEAKAKIDGVPVTTEVYDFLTR